MQVRGPDDRLRLRLQNLGEVTHVVHVVLDLPARMQQRPRSVGIDGHKLMVVGIGLRPAPLLQFDDQVRRRPGLRVVARDDHVGAFAAQRKAMFNEHLDVGQACLSQIRHQHRQGRLPGTHLAGRRHVPDVDRELLGQSRHRMIVEELRQQQLRRRPKQRHQNPRAARNGSCGWGSVLPDGEEARRAAT